MSVEVLKRESLSLSSDVCIISSLDYNKLPLLEENVVKMKNASSDSEEKWVKLLLECFSGIFLKHGLEDVLQVHLIHKHYKLNDGEKQVAAIETLEDGKKDGDDDNDDVHYVSKPRSIKGETVGKKLISLKWRLVKKDDDNNAYEWQSYEYLDENLTPNSDLYMNNSLKFELNKEFQKDLANVLIKYGLNNIVGLSLHFIPQIIPSNGGMAVELNNINERESRLLLISKNFDKRKEYQNIIKENNSVNTTWAIKKNKINNTLSCVICHTCICVGCK